MSLRTLSLSFAALLSGTAAAAPAPSADQAAFRAIYKELVETNTTLSAGSCTLAAERMAARLKAAGFADGRPPPLRRARPSRRKAASSPSARAAIRSAKAILLLAHIDVVEAKREDWARDPFTLVEENGYFYARGVVGRQSQAAIWVDTLIRYQAGRLHARSARSRWR